MDHLSLPLVCTVSMSGHRLGGVSLVGRAALSWALIELRMNYRSGDCPWGLQPWVMTCFVAEELQLFDESQQSLFGLNISVLDLLQAPVAKLTQFTCPRVVTCISGEEREAASPPVQAHDSQPVVMSSFLGQLATFCGV